MDQTAQDPAAPEFQLFMMLYAESPADRRASHNFLSQVDFHDMPMPLDFFCWVAVGGDQVVLIDSGCDEKTCQARGHNFLRSPIDGLASLGIAASAVTDVIVTHMHWDHLGNLPAFPNATLHVHKAEMAHATGCAMCHEPLRRPYDVDQVCDVIRALYADRARFTETVTDILPGLRVHPVGGHAPGLQVVEVTTARGQVVLASDAMHFYLNGALQNPYPVIVDLREYLDGLEYLRALHPDPDHIIPGHDPLLRSAYPEVPGTTGIWDLSQAPLVSRHALKDRT